MKRSSGVLMPIFSLPSRYGIGTLGQAAYDFVDFLVDTKQTYWQILPIMETSFGNSPYSAISSFAGNPFFIDLEMLIEDGLISETDLDGIDFGNDESRVDYGKIYANRFKVLKIASDNYKRKHPIAFSKFKLEYKFFLDEYAVFHAIKDTYNGAAFNTWDTKYKLADKDAIAEFRKSHSEEIEFYKVVQNLFYNQWFKLKKYANDNGIKIIGDTPIYSAYDSSEVWAHYNDFCLDENRTPIEVAGCPPDGFSADGQRWGNPLYNYDYIKAKEFKYFVVKFSNLKRLYDVIRIDHFRGFDSFYAIPYESPTAANGRWVQAPGKELFDVLKQKLGGVEILAEDLGFLTDSVKDLLRHTGFPGMKVLEFAFDSRDKNNTEYLPHTYPENSSAYIGTHDNDTFVGWLNSINENDRNYAISYLNLKGDGADHFRALTVLYESKSNLAVASMQDLLGIGTEGRINVPSTVSDLNWSYRFRKEMFDENIKKFFKDLTIKTNRA
ncbi:MAG: 4-alpha-glucanotransferase [Lachnospiraceae bacterium]|nr:4-alpha-glucanotransferase [Lachnospiraceae bacterium]